MDMIGMGGTGHDDTNGRNTGKSEAGKHWDRVVTRLRAELGEELYASWFARMKPEEIAGSTLIVSLPTRFLQNWVRTHYYARLLKIVSNLS